jgi:hypothetical protein
MQLHILHSNFLQKQHQKKKKECTTQADICPMFKKSCKSHTYSPITSKGVEVTQPGERTGSVEVGDLVASVVEVKALYSDIKCGGRGI